MMLDGLRLEAKAPHAVSHDLTLGQADLEAMAARHKGAVEQHRSDLPLLLPSGRRRSLPAAPAEAVVGLSSNATWITLFGVQADPLMRAITAQMEALVGERASVIPSLICSSASGVTPAHMDVYDVLLLQLRGRKRLGTGAFARRKVADEALRRRFSADRENLSELPDRQHEWRLEPGAGVFVPAYTPHWAHVGDEVSIALSVAVSTPALRRREAAHQADAALLRRHVRLPAPGRSRVVDGARVAVLSAGRRLR